MSLLDLGRELAILTERIDAGQEDPAVLDALLEALDTDDERAAVMAAIQQADLERWVAGRNRDEILGELEKDPLAWASSLFPDTCRSGFAPHMAALWQWAWGIRRGERPQPRVDIWNRGGSKSSTAEAISVALGSTGRRKYGLYVSGTQAQADKHVLAIAGLLESPRYSQMYPAMAKRAVGQYGTSKGWTRNRLWTSTGFVIDALGLQVEARGIRIETQRPDFMVFDDVDSKSDGPAMIEKKIELITDTLLPAGSGDLAVLMIQNLIHPASIFARLAGLAEEPADFLADRIVVGPIPAVRGLTTEVRTDEGGVPRHTITDGEPTWEGFGLQACQDAINTWGFTSFVQEAQHEVRARAGGMFSDLTYQHCHAHEVPALVSRTCWVDPAVTDTDGSDCQGIQIDGLGENGVIYRLWSWEGKVGPLGALIRAITMALRFGCGTVGVETDQGGDTWDSVYAEASRHIEQTTCPECLVRYDDETARSGHMLAEGHRGRLKIPGLRDAKAGRSQQSKAERVAHMLVDYEVGGLIVHVLGTHELLEAALFRFPRTKPFDLVDAAYWSWKYLSDRKAGPSRLVVPSGTLPKTPITRMAGGELRTPIRSR